MKKKIFTFILLVCCLYVTNPVMAQDCAYIKSTYSENITPNTGDNFEITYKAKSGKKTASFIIDASTITEGKTILNMPANDYEITKIKYVGNSEMIKKEGYAITSTFASSEEGDTITLGIGQVKAAEVSSMYMNSIYQPPLDYNNNEITTVYDRYAGESSAINETKTLADSTQSTIQKQQSQKYGEEETPVIETYQSNRKRVALYKLIPILVLAIGGTLAIFIAHKKGKI